MKNDQWDLKDKQLIQALIPDRKLNEIVDIENIEQQISELQKILLSQTS